jgi:hypothetical protein
MVFSTEDLSYPKYESPHVVAAAKNVFPSGRRCHRDPEMPGIIPSVEAAIIK